MFSMTYGSVAAHGYGLDSLGLYYVQIKKAGLYNVQTI